MVNLSTDVQLSQYLKAENVPEPVKWTIDGSEMEKTGPDEEKERPVLYFKEAPNGAGMVLNKTNIAKFKEDYGDEIDDFIGKEIVVYTIETQFGGKPCRGLRIRKPKDQQKQQEEPEW